MLLNSEQKAAITHKSGPLLIIAGAGTGKTTVITERIKYLILKKKASTDQVLALTFTQKAAGEMEERVDIALPYGYTDLWIMTFHAFCDRLLRDEAVQIGLNPDYRLISEAESIKLLQDHLFSLPLNYFRPLGNPVRFLDGLSRHFSRLKDEDVSPEQYLSWAKNLKTEKEEKKKYQELARVYQEYEKIKIEEGLMDFGDLITHVLSLFRKRPNVLRQYQKKFSHILIDEFQDTNIAQYQLLKLLAPPETSPDLTIVADDSQSVYKFRGAAVSNILQFKKDYPRAKMVSLIKNYRSYQEILDASYRLIKHNDPDTLEAQLKISKNLKSQRGRGGVVEFWRFNRFDEEAEAVAAKIKEIVKEGKYSYGDFAILLRTNRAAQNFIQSLRYQQIPYQFLGPGLLFHQPEIKDLIAYLSFLTNPNDNLALYRLLRLSTFGLSGRDLATLNGFAKNEDFSLFEALNIIANPEEKPANLPLPFLSLQARKTLEKITHLLNRHLELTKKEKSAGQMLYYFLQDSGLLAKMSEVKTTEEERRVKNIARFFEKLRQYELDHEDSSPEAVLSWINLSLSLGESPLASEVGWGEENRVNLLTVHSAKGLEFPVVFLVNLASDRFPLPQRREQIPIPEALIKEILPQGNYHEQEERRLFYVGMTRAADSLFLTAADYYGEKRKSRLSPFIFEALGEKNLEKKISPPLSLAEQLSIFKFTEEAEKEEREEKFILPPKISFSQLETFEHCPAQFYYAYIKRLPTPPTGSQNFGTTIHKTLLNFYQQVLAGREVSLDLLLDFYQKNWLPFGFKSRAWEKRLKKEGEQMLRRFFEEDFDPENKPLFLEKRFVFPLEKWRLSGVIDRVDKTSRGYEIIDYKTGKVMADREIGKSLQMTVYALAATDQGILGAKPEEITATFYFLSEGVKKSVQKSTAQLEKGRRELLKRLEALQKDKFLPQPGFWCDFCPYRTICDAW
ncbi:UvrD-helicase domain-containing protein [Candidatus Shapirobacteria bacterium]|nr:UvrD-helicase domain-containing protein [Candidatus Shapirobacteria bacterium]